MATKIKEEPEEEEVSLLMNSGEYLCFLCTLDLATKRRLSPPHQQTLMKLIPKSRQKKKPCLADKIDILKKIQNSLEQGPMIKKEEPDNSNAYRNKLRSGNS